MKSKFLIGITIFLIVISILILDWKLELSDNFLEGIWVEFHGVTIELLIVMGAFGFWSKYREDQQQRPARLLLSRRLCELHFLLFNSLRFLIDINYHADLKLHGFPHGTTQIFADSWARKHQVIPLDHSLDQLKKMLEYTNASLGSLLLPSAVSYIDLAEKLVSTNKFISKAYEVEAKRTNGPIQKHGISFDIDSLKEMERIYTDTINLFPELAKPKSSASTKLYSISALLTIIKEAEEKCPFLSVQLFNEHNL